MSEDLVQRLASEYLFDGLDQIRKEAVRRNTWIKDQETVSAGIDHGLGKPRPGDFTTMKKLQRDLLKEQDENLGGNREEMGKKWANTILEFDEELYGSNPVLKRLFTTTDLIMDITEANDEVTAVRSNIYHDEEEILHADGNRYIEHYYSATIVYHINLGAHLEGRGVTAERHDPCALALNNAVPAFRQYIEAHDARELLDRWLPGRPTDMEYDFSWDLKAVRYRPYAMVDLELTMTERWLTDA